MPANARVCAGRAALILAAFSLVACGSDEPSQSDMLQAVKSSPALRQRISAMAASEEILKTGKTLRAPAEEKAFNEKIATAVNEKIAGVVVEKASCIQAQGAPGYVCDFRIGSPQPNGQVRYGPPAKARFFKTASGWSFEKSR